MNAILYIIAFLWSFWALYVLVMGIYRAHLAKRLTPTTKVLAAPFVVVGYLCDVACNLTIASLVFAEMPREALVTKRLKRHVATGEGWRYRVADWICNHLLDVFDPTGNHC